MNLEIRELWDVLRYGVVQPPLAFFEQHHHGDASNRLRHRVNPEDRIAGHRSTRLDILHADHINERQLSVSSQHRDDSGELAVIDERLHPGVEPFKCVGGDTHVGRAHRVEDPAGCLFCARRLNGVGRRQYERGRDEGRGEPQTC